jgi:hypothetical protein
MLKKPPPAKIPPPETDPDDKAPVVKLTEPKPVPFVEDAEKPPNAKSVNCDPLELIVDIPIVPNPPLGSVIAIVPVWLVVVIVSAHVAIGNASASEARTPTTRLMFIVSNFFSPALHQPGDVFDTASNAD